MRTRNIGRDQPRRHSVTRWLTTDRALVLEVQILGSEQQLCNTPNRQLWPTLGCATVPDPGGHRLNTKRAEGVAGGIGWRRTAVGWWLTSATMATAILAGCGSGSSKPDGGGGTTGGVGSGVQTGGGGALAAGGASGAVGVGGKPGAGGISGGAGAPGTGAEGWGERIRGCRWGRRLCGGGSRRGRGTRRRPELRRAHGRCGRQAERRGRRGSEWRWQGGRG